MPNPQPRADLRATIAARGFALAPRLDAHFSDWGEARHRLIDDWRHLETDTYMRDGGRYRRRRFGRFFFLPATGEITRLQHAPVFQSMTVNGFAGGIQRDFAPLREATFDNACLLDLIRFDFACFEVPLPAMLSEPWEIWIHQIRIEVRGNGVGLPAPEGVHHDGHDFIAMHLIGRANVTGGRSIIYDNDQHELQAFLLEAPFDTIYADDHRVMHNVDPIRAADELAPAERDVLIIDFDHRPALRRSD